MATTSDVKSGLDTIAGVIAQNRSALAQAKLAMAQREVNLNDIPTKYSDVIETINAYASGDAFEVLAKAELSRLTAEFLALVADAAAAVASLAVLTEF